MRLSKGPADVYCEEPGALAKAVNCCATDLSWPGSALGTSAHNAAPGATATSAT